MRLAIAETPQVLLEQVAADLSACQDPFARHWLVLPGSGRAEWLIRRWSQIRGIASRSQLVSLRSVVEQAAASDAAGQAFSHERLVLAIAEELLKMPEHLPRGSDPRAVTSRLLAWSEQLADAIDVGLLCRGSQGTAETSPLLQALMQQPAVREVLQRHLGMLGTEAFSKSAKHWVLNWQERGGVPRLWVQLDAGLPRLILDYFQELASQLGDAVHLSLLSPSLQYWGDLAVRRQRDDQRPVSHILSSLGRCAQDLHNQSVDLFLSAGTGGKELLSPSTQDSLLGWLQQTCRDAEQPLGLKIIDSADWSVTVHACRTPLRELEICRDRCLEALASDPTLTADDICLMLADPDRYARLAQAAFAPLPVRLTCNRGSSSQFSTALQRLFRTLSGRMGITDIRDLIEEPLIAAKFDLSGRTEEVLEWLDAAQFRWGIDESHREELHGLGERRWNLAFALRRLGLGAVVDGTRLTTLVDGDVPLARATGLELSTLAHFTQLATALYEARRDWNMSSAPSLRCAKTLEQWSQLLISWCQRFIGDGESSSVEHRAQFINHLVPSLVGTSSPSLLVDADAIVRLVNPLLDSLGGSNRSNAAGVTVADLRQHAGTPARMVLVAGLGSEAFPRREDRPAWHPLSTRRQPGDPDNREADRHALLLALLSTGERLVLTYQGGSDEDGRERPASTPLTDLLAAIDAVATTSNGAKVSEQISFRHGLNGFSPSSCSALLPTSGRAQLAADYHGAAALLDSHNIPYSGLWAAPLAATHNHSLSLKNLSELLNEPCRIFLRRLGMQLPDIAEELTQHDILDLDPLDQWGVRDQLLTATLQRADPQALRQRLEAAGEYPPGAYADAAWRKANGELPQFQVDWLSPLSEPINIQTGSLTINAELPQGWYASDGGSLFYFSASSRKPRRLLQVKLALLVLSAAGVGSEVQTYFSKESKPRALVAPQQDLARTLIEQLCQLYELAECMPLPFWVRTYEKFLPQLHGLEDTQPSAQSREAILSAAWSYWTEPGDGTTPECQSPATRLCFRGLDDPFTWAPLAANWLQEPTTPLAWRLLRHISAWERKAGA